MNVVPGSSRENEFWSDMAAFGSTMVGLMEETGAELVEGHGIIAGAIEVGAAIATQSSDGELTSRDSAEIAGELLVTSTAGSIIVYAARGAGFGIPGVVAGAIVGVALGPQGRRLGGYMYDELYTPQEDPAGGVTGAGVQSPGSARVIGYEGRYNDGRGLALLRKSGF